MTEIYLTPQDDLQAAFDAAPENSHIRLAEGTYRQKIMLRTPGVTITGAGAGKTRIVFGDYARKRDRLGAEYNTFRTYTLAVCADRVTIRDLTIENDALHPEITLTEWQTGSRSPPARGRSVKAEAYIPR